MGQIENIVQKAIEILKDTPEGLRYANLLAKIQAALPQENINNIFSAFTNLRSNENVFQPARGFYLHAKFKDSLNDSLDSINENNDSSVTILEKDFYKSFANWLIHDMAECTKAIPLGGNIFKGKWETPDVIGILESKDIFKMPIKIISAEIKLDTNQLIAAFGQACSYRLFSHKSYLVVPKSSREIDTDRLDSLCLIFGIGLIYFDSNNKENPNFDIATRPRSEEPDPFYANEKLKILKEKGLLIVD